MNLKTLLSLSLCLTVSAGVCRDICAIVPLCASKANKHGSWCKTENNPSTCLGLYWRDRGRSQPCFSNLDNTCPQHTPVMCTDPFPMGALQAKSLIDEKEVRIEPRMLAPAAPGANNELRGNYCASLGSQTLTMSVTDSKISFIFQGFLSGTIDSVLFGLNVANGEVVLKLNAQFYKFLRAYKVPDRLLKMWYDSETATLTLSIGIMSLTGSKC
jgi:hypothetical protein